MALTYDTLVSQIANLLVISSADSNFQTMLPGMIDYAEQRLYRDLNFVNTTVTDTSVTTTADSRYAVLPQSVNGSTTGFYTITNINILSSAGTTSSNGTRNPVARSWQKMVDFLYPSNTSSGTGSIPSLYAIVGSTTPSVQAAQVMFGPPPGDAFTIEVTGTIRPTALSSTNTTTYLTNYFPDLFVVASMVYGSGYMRDFGQQSDNPGMSQSWEAQYKTLLPSAQMEQMRARYEENVDGRATGGSEL